MTLALQTVDRRRAFPPRMTRIHPAFLAGSCGRAFRDDAMRRLRASDVSSKAVLPTLLVASALPGCRFRAAANFIRRRWSTRRRRRFRTKCPYRVGIVDLDEGVRIATRVLADIEPKLDTAVEIVVLSYRDGPLFAARPLS